MNAPVQIESDVKQSVRALAPSLERRRLRLYLTMMAADIACILSAFFVAGGLYLGQWPEANAMIAAQLLVAIYATLGIYQAAYSIKALTEVKFAINRAMLALLVSSALLIFITFYTKSTNSFSRVIFTGALLLTACGIVALRLGLIWAVGKLWNGVVSNVMVIEAGGPEVELDNAIVLNAAKHGLVPDPDDPHSLDRLGRVFLNMDRVVVSCPDKDRPIWAFAMRSAGVKGELVSKVLTELRPMAISVDEKCVSLVVASGPLGLRARAFKRVFDVSVAGFALLLLWPVMLLAAIAIKLEDGGPILFVQRRLGRGNRFFNMLKLRSMTETGSDADGVVSASRDDQRITRIGRFLRRTSIDELPQLWNVVRGEMAVVGPRPHALGSQAGEKLFWEVDSAYWSRHALKPGLTGLAQVRGWRGATDMESDLKGRLDADLEYIANWTILRDFAILFGTVRVLIHDRAF
ncbi:sugar transferase [Altererythrobacter sp. ZODW24]|uniref:sugar transferase n=1 Tax=Altererythrobacter sp. ZODW24 TaxID=2185142 RepID=UPI000DF7FE1F|nr:sugar transferase [Altererythrobacter sp. ZODW24]